MKLWAKGHFCPQLMPTNCSAAKQLPQFCIMESWLLHKQRAEQQEIMPFSPSYSIFVFYKPTILSSSERFTQDNLHHLHLDLPAVLFIDTTFIFSSDPLVSSFSRYRSLQMHVCQPLHLHSASWTFCRYCFLCPCIFYLLFLKLADAV